MMYINYNKNSLHHTMGGNVGGEGVGRTRGGGGGGGGTCMHRELTKLQ